MGREGFRVPWRTRALFKLSLWLEARSVGVYRKARTIERRACREWGHDGIACPGAPAAPFAICGDDLPGPLSDRVVKAIAAAVGVSIGAPEALIVAGAAMAGFGFLRRVVADLRRGRRVS